jgi:hypothetical protein
MLDHVQILYSSENIVLHIYSVLIDINQHCCQIEEFLLGTFLLKLGLGDSEGEVVPG